MSVDYRFNTSALRLAQVFDLTDVGKVVQDLENSSLFWVIAAGSGIATMAAFPSRYGYIHFPIHNFKEVTSGDVGNIAANGGVLASDTTPILRAGTNSQELVWAAANVDVVMADAPMPADLDDTQDVLVMLRTASGGTTDAATIICTSVIDSAAGFNDTATGAASTTEGNAQATVDKADIPAGATQYQLLLTPNTHGTDTMILRSCKIRYTRKQ